MIRVLRSTLLLLFSVAMGFAAQSLRVTSGVASVTLPNAAPWTTIGANTQPMRWEVRVHGWGQGQFPDGPILVLPGGVSIFPYSATGLKAAGSSLQDSSDNNGPGVANCCVGHQDVVIRVQRDVANQRYTLEVHDTASNFYGLSTVPILSFGPRSWAGTSLRISPGTDVAWIQWYSSVTPIGTPIPVTDTGTGDLGSWKFNGAGSAALADSSAGGGGSFNHSANNLSGGTTTTVTTPDYAPLCDPGAQQTFRVGHAGTLDGTASQALDGGASLSYAWRQVSGPVAADISDPATVSPKVTAAAFGTYVFELTVTDRTHQSASCTIKDGAVATDDHGLVITGNPPVDSLLGPLVRWGANPWPWFDNRHKAAADVQIANSETYYKDFWNTPSTGTVTVTPGSNAVTGNGTSFKSLLCGGGTSPKAWITVWYPAQSGTGRRELPISTCIDDTHLTLGVAWSSDVPGGAGLSFSYDDFTNAWDYQNGPANFYDNVAAFYSLYYRSGIDDYLTAARRLADRYYTSPQFDRGVACNINGYPVNCTFGAFIYRVTLGLVLRALDGRPDMWTGLKYLWNFDHYYIHDYYPAHNYPGGIPDARSNGYLLMDLSYCGMFAANADGTPDNATRGSCNADLTESLTTLWTPSLQSDGSHPSFHGAYNSWTTNTSARLTHGSSTVAGVGNPWTAAMFDACAAPPMVGCAIWFTPAPQTVPLPSQGDTKVYFGTFTDPNTITLHDIDGKVVTYEGTSGIHGWVTADPNSGSLVGWGTQPYAGGLLGAGFDLAGRSLAKANPADPNATLYREYGAKMAYWERDKGTQGRNSYLYSGFSMCVPPMTAEVFGCYAGNSGSARVLNAEVLKGVIAAYRYNNDRSLRVLAERLFSGMWSRPGTAGPDPDGVYIQAMDDDGYYMTGTPPTGQSPKYFGQFFGISLIGAWPGARLDGISKPAASAGVTNGTLGGTATIP